VIFIIYIAALCVWILMTCTIWCAAGLMCVVPQTRPFAWPLSLAAATTFPFVFAYQIMAAPVVLTMFLAAFALWQLLEPAPSISRIQSVHTDRRVTRRGQRLRSPDQLPAVKSGRAVRKLSGASDDQGKRPLGSEEVQPQNFQRCRRSARRCPHRRGLRLRQAPPTHCPSRRIRARSANTRSRDEASGLRWDRTSVPAHGRLQRFPAPV
jgi:hypothetical protein